MASEPLMEAGHRQRQAPSAPSSRRRWFGDWWLLELLGVGFSCVTLVILCIVLAHFDHQAAPCIGPTLNVCMQLNTVVALLVTLAVATALYSVQECIGQLKWLWYQQAHRPLSDLDVYDNASRGSLGSLRLLGQARLASSPLALLASILVIFQLAVAPLAQQAVFQYSENVSIQRDSEPGSIYQPLATINIAKSSGTARNSIRVTDVYKHFSEISSGMKAAIFTGLFSGGWDVGRGINHTTPYCSSGNCTYAPYSTLSVCASVQNVTSSFKRSGDSVDNTSWCLPGGLCLYDRAGASSDEIDSDSVYGINVTSAVAPENNPNMYSAPKWLNSVPTLPPMDYVQLLALNYSSVAFANHTHPLADVFIMYQQDVPARRAVALEFVVDWCERHLETNVTNGTAETRDFGWEWLSLTAAKPLGNQPGYVAAQATGNTYNIDVDLQLALQRYFTSLFNGTVAWVTGGSPYTQNQNVIPIADQLQDYTQYSYFGTRTAPMSPDQALMGLLQNMAISVTNYLRDSADTPDGILGSDHANIIQGTAFSQQNTIAISWGWLAAPLAFTAISTILVVLVVLLADRPTHHAAGSARPLVWKSSSLAAVRALDADLQRIYGGMAQNHRMEEDAKQLLVRLIPESSGWRLVSESPGSKMMVDQQELREDRALMVESK